MKLLLQGVVKFVTGIALMGLLIFLPAGTVYYFNGWLMMGILFCPMLIMGVVLFVKNPELLKERLDSKEKQGTQKGVVALSGLMFLSGFVVAGLDYRFTWFPMPLWVSLAAAVVFLVSYALYAEVLRENTYLSRTIKVQENQKVIDTGLYGIVRHPMYSATIIMFLSIPLILGSIIAFFIFLIYPVIIIIRIGNEEKVLSEQLEGYTEYCRKIKYRLIPFIW